MVELFNQKRSTTVAITNIGLRIGATGSKFLLLLVLARYLEPSDIGVFGLVTASILVALSLIGADYYVFTTRELLGSDPSEQRSLVVEQMRVHFIAYLIAIPFIVLLFGIGLLPSSVAIWFLPLLIAEHLSMEGYRLLVALSRSQSATIVLSVRSGVWALILAVAMVFFPSARNLDILWPVWFSGSTMAVFLAAWWLRDIWQQEKHLLQSRRIFRGLRIALPFLVSTLSIRGIFALDRYFIEFYHSTDEVGIYTFFFGIANFILLVVEAGVVVVQFPAVVGAFQKGDFAGYGRLIHRFKRSVLAAVVISAIIVSVGIWPVLFVIDQPLYQRELMVFWLLVVSIGLSAVSVIPHYQLYAAGRDRPIVLSALLGFCVAAATNALLVPQYGARGAAAATLIAMSLILFCKFAFAMKGRKKHAAC